MNIKEYYVSFEVAKLLKEKGFHEPCIATYNLTTKDFAVEEIYQDWTTCWKTYVSAPTLQMVCKWLREEKNLCIYVFPHKDGYEYGKWEAGICYCDDAIDATINACGHIFGETYDEAVEAALKYCLENLI